ncbi:hypothetical protein GF415_03740 [Candidatus Micrarchaeota archaeon]|nr:hypothetical protein [Candidatus Micrarchaeota archaeon]
MKKIMIALVLIAALFAAGVEDAVAGYYAANKNEDIEEFMEYVDTSGREQTEIDYEQEMVLAIWEAYDTEEYYIEGLEYSTDASGEYAMAGYLLNATISGAENFNYELDYVMLLHKVGGNWKVKYVMPYEEYVNMSEQARGIAAIDYLAEEEHRLASEQVEAAEPTFDGMPPQDLSSEIASASGGGQEGIASKECSDTWDCTWDETCKDGVCVPAPQQGCGTAFVLLALAGGVFAGVR